jgi:hypothetical protein
MHRPVGWTTTTRARTHTGKYKPDERSRAKHNVSLLTFDTKYGM